MSQLYFLHESIQGLATPLRIEGKNYTLSLAGDNSNGHNSNYIRTYLAVWDNITHEDVCNEYAVTPELLFKWLRFVIDN